MMLNSEELEQLRIQGLMETPLYSSPKRDLFCNLTSLYNFSDHITLIGWDANANIRAYLHILLYSIRGVQGRKNEEEGRYARLRRLLLSEATDLLQVQGMQSLEEKVSEVWTQYPHVSPRLKNHYLKKLLFEYILNLTSKPKSPSSITYSLQLYPIINILLSLFIRSILSTEYEITQALDFSEPISDHTLYTALCDAFEFTGLRLEQNQAYIGKKYMITCLPWEEKKLYFIGRKKQEEKQRKLEDQFHTFRAGQQVKEDGETDRKKEESNEKYTPEFKDSITFREVQKQFVGKFDGSTELKKVSEFSSQEIIRQLSPTVRDSMMNRPMFNSLYK